MLLLRLQKVTPLKKRKTLKMKNVDRSIYFDLLNLILESVTLFN